MRSQLPRFLVCFFLLAAEKKTLTTLVVRNTSSIGAWPNSLDQRPTWYCIYLLCYKTWGSLGEKRSIKKLQNPATQNTRHEAGPFRVLCVHSTFVTTKGSRKGTSVKLSWEASVPELAEGSMRHFLTKVVSHYLVLHYFICFIWQKIDKNQKDSLVKNIQLWFSEIFCQMKFFDLLDLLFGSRVVVSQRLSQLDFNALYKTSKNVGGPFFNL